MLSGYRLMWLFVMFDLPVITKTQRQQANRFRLDLLDLGFLRCQLSVYMKFCTSRENVHSIRRQVFGKIPPKGTVTTMVITDAQFKKIQTFQSRINIPQKNSPKQLELF